MRIRSLLYNQNYFRLLPYLCLIISNLPIITLKYPGGDDWFFELVRVSEFKTALEGGQYPPFWGSNLYGGYGSPIFLFYAPLHMCIATFCSYITGGIANGSVLALILISIVGLFAVKLTANSILREINFVNETACRVAVYLFILNPYFIEDKLIRNANAEYTALCIFPFALYGIFILGCRPLKGFLIISISLALTILSHNLTALILATVASILSIVLYVSKKKRKILLLSFAAILLGLGISAFFWMPAIYYKSLVHIDQMVTGKFDFRNNFQSLGSIYNPKDIFSISLLIPVIIISSLVALFDSWNKQLNRIKIIHIALLIFAVLLIFLQFESSKFIWESIAYLPLFQFPWRMRGPLAIFSSLLVTISFAYYYRGKSSRYVKHREILLFIFCVTYAIPFLLSSKPLPDKMLKKIPTMINSEFLKNNNMPATVGDEYLPKSACPTIWYERPSSMIVIQNPPDVIINIIEDKGTRITLKTSSEVETTIHIARWYFPMWRCLINGSRRDVKENEFGTLSIVVPPGSNQIVLMLFPPVLRQFGLWLSVLSFCMWCFTAFRLRFLVHNLTI